MIQQAAHDLELEFEFDPEHTQIPVLYCLTQHDIKVDAYGKLMATCSADGSINVFELDQKLPPRIVATAKHSSPVNCIEWGPKDQVCRLASCSDEGSVVIYRFENNNLVLQREVSNNWPMTSVAWCNQEDEMLLAASGLGGAILFLRYESSEWSQETLTVVMEARADTPSFVSWSPEHVSQCFLLWGQCDVLKTFAYKATGDNFAMKPLETYKFQVPEIRDVTWQETLGDEEEQRPIVLLSNKVVFFEKETIGKGAPAQLSLELGANDFATKLGWSDEGTRLNVYCYRRQQFVTLSLACSFGGKWKLEG